MYVFVGNACRYCVTHFVLLKIAHLLYVLSDLPRRKSRRIPGSATSACTEQISQDLPGRIGSGVSCPTVKVMPRRRAQPFICDGCSRTQSAAAKRTLSFNEVRNVRKLAEMLLIIQTIAYDKSVIHRKTLIVR